VTLNTSMKFPIPALLSITLPLLGGLVGFSCLGATVEKEKKKDASPSPAGEWNAAAETVVIFNPSFPGSEELAKFYAEKRNIPAAHLLPLPCSKDETISRDEFEETIRGPLLQAFKTKKWWEIERRDVLDPNGKPYKKATQVVAQHMHVVVLMRGMPLRIKRASPKADLPVTEVDEASVDSEIAALGLLDRPIKGPLENRYYQSTRRFADHYEARGQLIVGRLDAPDDATVKRMIEDSLEAEHDGLWGRAVIAFALKDGAYAEGETWLGNCVRIYRESGIPVYADRSKEVLRDGWPLPDTILYFGWYANRCSGALASPDFRFKPGAIACHLHSYSAATLRSRTDNWCGPLLDHGAAAVLGNVWEPYLTLTTHFDLFNARLLDGLTLGEAAWSATPAISWMSVVVGDPLYRPFRKDRPLTTSDPHNQSYAIYQDLARRFLTHDGKKFRREILHAAEERQSATLLELTGLLSTIEGFYGEADDFLEHAGALFPKPADQLRCKLYDAELELRKGDAEEGRVLLKNIATEPKFSKLPGLTAAIELEKSSGVK
jgi:uncharacterized protein (TIGR03790 family)